MTSYEVPHYAVFSNRYEKYHRMYLEKLCTPLMCRVTHWTEKVCFVQGAVMHATHLAVITEVSHITAAVVLEDCCASAVLDLLGRAHFTTWSPVICKQ
jgi:hypothetical protein